MKKLILLCSFALLSFSCDKKADEKATKEDVAKTLELPNFNYKVFEKISGKFDLILFNPPYLPEDKREDTASSIATTGGKKGDEIILRFISKAKSHLNNNGIILLLLSSLTPKDKILSSLKKYRFKKEILEKNILIIY